MAHRTLLVTYIATYLLAVGSIIRYLPLIGEDRLWPFAILVGGYLVLLLLEPLYIRRHRVLTYISLLVQSAIICTISVVAPAADFWAVLFCPLVVQVMHNFPQRTGFLITGVFTAITSVFLLWGLGLEVGLPLILVFAVIYFLLAAFIAIILEAVAARDESQKQQAELQAAHRQLQTYTARAEELAVLQERNRLARELHDSVTQSLYSLTLLAEAGQRMIRAEDLQQIAGNQTRLGQIAQQALQEMRLLVYELRPLALKSEGLVGALEQRLETVERRAGIQARVLVEGEVDLAPGLEEELYGIAQEALNNALKHARASKIVLSVRMVDKSVILEVADDGQGFDQAEVQVKGGLGLISMQERAEKIGGQLDIDSALGEGTRVSVKVLEAAT
ncbi:MAG: sensor histidine kinase [Anaerolineae bacterium]|jgi:signal transduction histidine kinase